MESEMTIRCSFCQRPAPEVEKLIAGPGHLHLRPVRQPMQRDPRAGVSDLRPRTPISHPGTHSPMQTFSPNCRASHP